MLESKLERLLRQCYPPGRSSEKRAKPSELSYLMYYAVTHRSKIFHIAELLRARAIKYLSKNRTGNAMVSLEIFENLVEKCHEDLNVFATYVLSTLRLASASQELPIVNSASNLYSVFNRYHSGVLFSGDSLYVDDFLALAQQYVDLSTIEVTTNTAKSQKHAALRGLASVTTSPILHTTIGARILQLAVPAFYRNLIPDSDGGHILAFNRDCENYDRKHDSEQELINSTPETVALYALRNIFGSSSSTQVANSTATLLSCFKAKELENYSVWARVLLKSVTEWCQVQSRFIVLKRLVSEMGRLSIDDLDGQLMFCNLLYGPVVSNVSLVGLGVVDIFHSLLDLQQRLIVFEWPDNNSATRAQSVVESLFDFIGRLARHNFYAGQVSDMLNEVLFRYAVQLEDLKSQSLSVSAAVIMNDLRIVQNLIDSLSTSEKVSLSDWAPIVWILSRTEVDLLVLFTETFTMYIKHAHHESNPQDSGAIILGKQLTSVALNKSNTPANMIAIYHNLIFLVHHLDRGSPSLLPWVMQLQDQGLKVEHQDQSTLSSTQGAALISASQAILLAIARCVQRVSSSDLIYKTIQTRVSVGRWLTGISYPFSTGLRETLETARSNPQARQPMNLQDGPLKIDIQYMELTSEEKAWFKNPSLNTTDESTDGGLSIFRQRARSLNDSIKSNSHKLPNSRTFSSGEVDAPKSTELRRRVHSNVSALSRNGSQPSHQSSKHSPLRLSTLLESLNLKSDNNRGVLFSERSVILDNKGNAA